MFDKNVIIIIRTIVLLIQIKLNFVLLFRMSISILLYIN